MFESGARPASVPPAVSQHDLSRRSQRPSAHATENLCVQTPRIRPVSFLPHSPPPQNIALCNRSTEYDHVKALSEVGKPVNASTILAMSYCISVQLCVSCAGITNRDVGHRPAFRTSLCPYVFVWSVIMVIAQPGLLKLFLTKGRTGRGRTRRHRGASRQ
jgi:hypothetical protein